MGCKKIVAAILGFGNIGSGVAEILTRDQDNIERFSGMNIELRYILDIRSFPGHPLERLFVNDIGEILADPDVTVVVEAIGGVKYAFDFDMRCLEAGKSVVTSNKELVASKGAELLAAASRNGCRFLFEAAVGGTAPIIAPMLTTLSVGRFISAGGILNGTTNFMLTRMKRDGASFDEALAVARELGYAETADPSDDVDGIDAKRKISIVASIMTGGFVDPNSVECRGIRGIDPEDFKLAEELGGTIKLIAFAKRVGEALEIAVSPMFVPMNCELYMVEDVYNGILFDCEFAGRILTVGRGAGKMPTAGVVIADMMEASCGRKIIGPAWSGQKPKLLPPAYDKYMTVSASQDGKLSAGFTGRPVGLRCYPVWE